MCPQIGGSACFPPVFDPTVQTGAVIFVDDENRTRQIDFVSAPLGIGFEEILNHAVEVKGPPPGLWGFRVMSPFHCLVSRVAVVAALHRTSEHALQQLRASILCARIAAKRRALDDPKEARKQNEQVPENSRG